MIIDTTRPRAEYFERPKAHEIVSTLTPELSGSQLSRQDFMDATASGFVRAATNEGSIDSLFEDNDDDDVIRAIETAGDDQLILLPPQYSIRGSANKVLSYSQRSLMKLDSRSLSRHVLGTAYDRLSLKKKQELNWRFSWILPAEFERRQEAGESNKHLVGISWWGVGNHQRRVMSLYRSLQGAELKAFQDLAFFRLRNARASALKNRKGRFEGLSEEEVSARLEKIRAYSSHVKKRGLDTILGRLDVSFDDLIEEAARPFNGFQGQSFYVPASDASRQYLVEFTQLPVDAPIGREWELRASCECRDYRFHKNRRRTRKWAQDEDYRCKHQEAALHAVRKLGSRYGYEMEFPGIFPLKPLVDIADRLRYNTLVVDGKSKRELSATEMDNILMKTVVARGPERYISCDPKDLSGDLRLEYVKVR